MQNNIVSLMDGPCATENYCIYTCGSSDTGRKKNLEPEFKAEILFLVHCARYIVKAIDFLRKTFLAVGVRHSFPALTETQ